MLWVADVALVPQASTELPDVARAQARLLGEGGPARADHAVLGAGLRAEPAEHSVLVPGDPAELEMLVDGAAPAEVVVGAGRSCEPHVSRGPPRGSPRRRRGSRRA